MANILITNNGIEIDDKEIGKCANSSIKFIYQIRLTENLSEDEIESIYNILISFIENGEFKEFNLSNISDSKIVFDIFDIINGHSKFEIYYNNTEKIEGIVVGDYKKHFILIELFQEFNQITKNSFNIIFSDNTYKNNTGFMIHSNGLIPLPTLSDDYEQLDNKVYCSLDEYKFDQEIIKEKIQIMNQILLDKRGDTPPFWIFKPFENNRLDN